jgi:hypothetical protein
MASRRLREPEVLPLRPVYRADVREVMLEIMRDRPTGGLGPPVTSPPVSSPDGTSGLVTSAADMSRDASSTLTTITSTDEMVSRNASPVTYPPNQSCAATYSSSGLVAVGSVEEPNTILKQVGAPVTSPPISSTPPITYSTPIQPITRQPVDSQVGGIVIGGHVAVADELALDELGGDVTELDPGYSLPFGARPTQRRKPLRCTLAQHGHTDAEESMYQLLIRLARVPRYGRQEPGG